MSDMVSADQLLSFIERIERLEEEKAEVQEQIKEVKAEYKNEGFCPKTLAVLLRLRKKSEVDRQEEETILEVYKNALGM